MFYIVIIVHCLGLVYFIAVFQIMTVFVTLFVYKTVQCEI